MSIMTTPMAATSITTTVMAGTSITITPTVAMWTMTTPTVVMGTVGMLGRPTTVTVMLTATVILPEPSGTGGRMRGIISAVTSIITGSRVREEST